MSATPLAETAAAERASATSARRIDQGGEFLTFRLGAEEYGIDILRVQEIRSYEAPTRIANAPAFMKGVVNLRGVIVPIVDLRVKFGLPDPAYDTFTVVVILNIAQRVVGIVVDSVSDVIELGADRIRPMPELHGAIDAAFILGLGTLEGREGHDARMLILTDIEAVMTSADMGLIDAAALH